MKKPNTKCEICEKPLYRRPADLERYKHFCCKECRSELYKREGNYNKAGLERGRGWNKGMSKANGDELKYGKPRSEKTKRRISRGVSRARGKSGHHKKCRVCGEAFYVFPSNEKRGLGIYCSNKCKFEDSWKQECRICANCGNEFSVHQASQQFLCSRKCALEYRGPTDIEIAMEDWLKEQEIEYEVQKSLCAVTVADFFVAPNIAIYCDGDYWHNLPKNKQQDGFVNKVLKTNGYRVIRLLGSEIKEGVRPVELLHQD